MRRPVAGIYALAGLVIAIWGSTFISTKILLAAFTPVEIIVYRFAAAYLVMFALYPRFHKPESLKTEITLALAGISGGSLYFLAENFALDYSFASNVSLLVSTAPILTAILAHFFLNGERLGKRAVVGAVIAFAGAGLVILNGKFVLKLNPLGDFLAVLSALSWAVYSVLVRNLDTKRSPYYVTRKIFFWTLVTTAPVLLVSPVRFDLSPLLEPAIFCNLAFLVCFASSLAYVAWNHVIWSIGATKANNLIYFIPLFTLAESVIFLAEPLTPFAIAGAVLIFAGIFVTEGGRYRLASEKEIG